jgi:multisubunit Na+/H+ antiporter MnhG subunit
MSNEQIKRIIEDSYDESKEEGLRSIVRDFYTRKQLASAVLAWSLAIVFIGLAIYSGIHFFRTDQTQWQIVYAALFIVGVHEFGMIRTFVWQMAHRQNLKRDLKRLELRVAELSEALRAR